MTVRASQPARWVVVLVALLVAGLLAGCGGGGDKKTIPNDQAATLIRQLKKAEAAAGDVQQCPALARAVAAAQATVQSLPASVDKDTRATLTNGVKNLADTARQECANANTQTTTTPTETTPTTPTTNTQTTPTTNTQTTPTTNTQTTPTTDTQPPPPPTTPGNGGAGPGQGGGPPGQGKKHGKDDKPPKGKEK